MEGLDPYGVCAERLRGNEKVRECEQRIAGALIEAVEGTKLEYGEVSASLKERKFGD